jgi:hypothetical protein
MVSNEQLSERWGLAYCAHVVNTLDGPRLADDVDICDNGRLLVRAVSCRAFSLSEMRQTLTNASPQATM